MPPSNSASKPAARGSTWEKATKRASRYQKVRPLTGHAHGWHAVHGGWFVVLTARVSRRSCTNPLQEEFPELHNVLFWLRLVIAAALGVAVGLADITGSTGVATFVAVAVVLPYVYYAVYLEVDVADYGAGALVTEGLMPALGMFVLTWMTVYTAMHGTPVALPHPVVDAPPAAVDDAAAKE
jgi:hypothetical protein